MPHELTSASQAHALHPPPREFLELSPADQVSMLLNLPPEERMTWVRRLPLDDAADLVQAAPAVERDGLLGALDDAARGEVTALMAYSEDVAGGLMNPRFVRLRPELTIDEAISYLRKQGPDVNVPIHHGYVLDRDQRLLGVIPTLTLFSSPAGQTIRDLMNADPVAELFGSYGEYSKYIATTVSLSLVGVVLWGTLAGSTLPFILRLFNMDPASASAPFVATLVDVTGLIIYFTVAGIVLRGTLL